MWKYMDCSAIFPGPVKRFQQIWPALAKMPVESFWNIVCICTRAVLVNPAARFDVNRLAGRERDFKHIAVAVQPENALLRRA